MGIFSNLFGNKNTKPTPTLYWPVPGLHNTSVQELEALGASAERRITAIYPGSSKYRPLDCIRMITENPEYIHILTLRTPDNDALTTVDQNVDVAVPKTEWPTKLDNYFIDLYNSITGKVDIIVMGNEIFGGEGALYPQTPEHFSAYFDQVEHLFDYIRTHGGEGVSWPAIINFSVLAERFNTSKSTYNSVVNKAIREMLTRAINYSNKYKNFKVYLDFHLGKGTEAEIDTAFATLKDLVDGTRLGVIFTEFRGPTQIDPATADFIKYFLQKAREFNYKNPDGKLKTISYLCYGPTRAEGADPVFAAKALLKDNQPQEPWFSFWRTYCAAYKARP